MEKPCCIIAEARNTTPARWHWPGLLAFILLAMPTAALADDSFTFGRFGVAEDRRLSDDTAHATDDGQPDARFGLSDLLGLPGDLSIVARRTGERGGFGGFALRPTDGTQITLGSGFDRERREISGSITLRLDF